MLNGGMTSHACAVSACGRVIAGYADDGSRANARCAVRWSEADGLRSLGTQLNGGHYSAASAISADGSTIVGVTTDGQAGEALRARLARGYRHAQPGWPQWRPDIQSECRQC